jgi:hypothetical protein
VCEAISCLTPALKRPIGKGPSGTTEFDDNIGLLGTPGTQDAGHYRHHGATAALTRENNYV